MAPISMQIVVIGNDIQLKRDQWKGNVAYISNYPGLLDEVAKYTWTYSDGDHPYLRCSKLSMYLHKFVLGFLYGWDEINEMLGRSSIIEHLDNNGLNCTYENLHVLSEDFNKAKAFTIDKENASLENESDTIPPLITDVYYLHDKKYFQMQIFFNVDLCINQKTQAPVESFTLRYEEFVNLYIDWLYCFECIKKNEFDISKHHAVQVYEKYRPTILLTEEEKSAQLIERDGKYYIVLRTKDYGNGISFMNHTALRNMDEE